MDGLNKQQVDYRIDNGLVNNENIKNSRTTKSIILSNLLTLFNFIHIVLFILVLTTGAITNATFMIAIIINICISIYQEIKAKIIIDKLKITNTSKVKVVRDKEIIEIAPEEIVIDDLLYLKQGDSLVVDAKVVKSENCEVDESIITGESDAILKKENDNLISGSIITCGSAYAKVTSINRDTYANKLIKEASKSNDNSSYLMNNINFILKIVTFLIVPIGVLLFITQFFYSNQTYSESILSSVAGIIGMIPDGLVLLTSISLTIGVIKMASKKVIVQKLSGIELLACIDTLCLDKTGTITDGSMDVVDVVIINKKYDINELIANIINEDGNITDKALIKHFSKKNNLEKINYRPFTSKTKYTMVEFTEGTYCLGALEYLTNKKVEEYSELKKYIEIGYRILTLIKVENKFDKDKNEILAFVILKDNVRKNAKNTLEYFKKQNVEIKIISGDNPLTVSNILKQLEFDGYDKYISGLDLPEKYEDIKKIVDNYNIYGRVTPEQKRSIIKALKEKKTVGMIGDGVNDILALKEADCGIALASGVGAARNVSEIVLTDEDFGILPSIVNEGRRVINNIERVASMYLIKTLYSFLISIMCIILNHEYPFYPIQLSLISGICVGIPSFFLAIEPNYTKVEKGFLVKVFRNALPSAICVFLSVFFIIMFTSIFNLNYEDYRFIVVGITGYLNLRLLYNISKPLTTIRKILVYLCSISFYLLLFIFSKFFLIESHKILPIMLGILIIIADRHVTIFLEELYDKYILYRKKRSKNQ